MSTGRRLPAVGALCLVWSGGALAQMPAVAPLVLEGKIRLGEVRGRIDHLAVDLKRQRLFVAELGNDTVAVVDLKERSVVLTLTGLKEPQGIGYVPSTDTVYVANAADGSLRMFQGPELYPLGRVELGDDADNVRVDDAAHEVWVGYGSGALAIIDAISHRKVADIPLKAHPESFRLDASGQWAYANVPGDHEIAVVDRAARKQTGGWSTGTLSGNYPLILDEPHQRVLAVFRSPPRVGVFSRDRRLLAEVETCGDSDDAFIDAKRHVLYVICGAGYIDVLAERGDGYARVSRIETLAGARTGLFVPELERLYLAARARSSSPATIWVFRPAR